MSSELWRRRISEGSELWKLLICLLNSEETHSMKEICEEEISHLRRSTFPFVALKVFPFRTKTVFPEVHARLFL